MTAEQNQVSIAVTLARRHVRVAARPLIVLGHDVRHLAKDDRAISFDIGHKQPSAISEGTPVAGSAEENALVALRDPHTTIVAVFGPRWER